MLPALPLLDPRPNAVRTARLQPRPVRRCSGRIFHLLELLLQPLKLGVRLGPLLDQLVLLLNFLIRRRILTAIIVRILVYHKPIRDPANEEPPEQVDCLQRGKQGKGDVLADPALVLLRFPVEFKGTNGFEGCENGPDDLEVNVVTRVAPDAHEDEEVRTDNGGVDVI